MRSKIFIFFMMATLAALSLSCDAFLSPEDSGQLRLIVADLYNRSIESVSTDGTSVQRKHTPKDGRFQVADAVLSQDGKKIAMADKYFFSIVDVHKGTSNEILTPIRGFSPVYSFSKDGNSVIFRADPVSGFVSILDIASRETKDIYVKGKHLFCLLQDNYTVVSYDSMPADSQFLSILYATDTRTGETREVLLTHKGSMSAILPSPKSNEIAFYSYNDNKAYILNIPNGKLSILHDGDYIPQVWSADGQTVLLCRESAPHTIARVERDGTNFKAIATPHDGSTPDEFSWSPDNTAIAFMETSHDGAGMNRSIAVLKTDGTGVRYFTPPGNSLAVLLGWSIAP